MKFNINTLPKVRLIWYIFIIVVLDKVHALHSNGELILDSYVIEKL